MAKAWKAYLEDVSSQNLGLMNQLCCEIDIDVGSTGLYHERDQTGTKPYAWARSTNGAYRLDRAVDPFYRHPPIQHLRIIID